MMLNNILKKANNLVLYFLFFTILMGELMGNSLPKYYTKTLNNGLQVVAIPMDNGSKVISTDIFYKVGSKDEKMGKSGMAHMLEHLNFKSTKNLKSGEFDKIVKSFGGVDNASTGFDFTHYYIRSSSKNMGKSLKLFAEVMENLTLKDEEFQPERDVVMEERRWRTDNSPMGYMQFRLFNNAYVYHPYHWTPIGFVNDIKNWSLEDIKDFHNTFYQPKNAIIVVAGDIKKDEVFEQTQKYFEGIKNKKQIHRQTYTVEPKQDGEKRLVVKKDSQVEMMAIAYHIPNFENKDQVALSALSQLLSSGKSSLLRKVLVDEKKLVNSIGAYNMELKDPGVFIFVAVCNEGVKAKDVEKAILKIINDVKKGHFKQKEIDKIKINTKADFIFSLESSSSVASILGSYFARGNIKPLFEYEDNLNKLEKKDIVDVAKKYLTKDNSTTIFLEK